MDSLIRGTSPDFPFYHPPYAPESVERAKREIIYISPTMPRSFNTEFYSDYLDLRVEPIFKHVSGADRILKFDDHGNSVIDNKENIDNDTTSTDELSEYYDFDSRHLDINENIDTDTTSTEEFFEYCDFDYHEEGKHNKEKKPRGLNSHNSEGHVKRFECRIEQGNIRPGIQSYGRFGYQASFSTNDFNMEYYFHESNQDGLIPNEYNAYENSSHMSKGAQNVCKYRHMIHSSNFISNDYNKFESSNLDGHNVSETRITMSHNVLPDKPNKKRKDHGDGSAQYPLNRMTKEFGDIQFVPGNEMEIQESINERIRTLLTALRGLKKYQANYTLDDLKDKCLHSDIYQMIIQDDEIFESLLLKEKPDVTKCINNINGLIFALDLDKFKGTKKLISQKHCYEKYQKINDDVSCQIHESKELKRRIYHCHRAQSSKRRHIDNV